MYPVGYSQALTWMVSLLDMVITDWALPVTDEIHNNMNAKYLYNSFFIILYILILQNYTFILYYANIFIKKRELRWIVDMSPHCKCK